MNALSKSLDQSQDRGIVGEAQLLQAAGLPSPVNESADLATGVSRELTLIG